MPQGLKYGLTSACFSRVCGKVPHRFAFNLHRETAPAGLDSFGQQSESADPLVGGRFLPDRLCGIRLMHRGGVSDLRKLAQAGVTTIGAFNYLEYDPSGMVFLAASRKKQARPLKGDFHFSYRWAIEDISDHLISVPLLLPKI